MITFDCMKKIKEVKPKIIEIKKTKALFLNILDIVL